MSSQPQLIPLALIVDDEVSICSALCGVLADESWHTEFALNGPDAVQKVHDLKPDVVFLDIWMPGWDGIETLQRIKAISPSTEVIMISGHATISNALEATKRGAFDFIEKPLNLESVILSAVRALEKKRSQHQSLSAQRSSPSDQVRDPLLTHVGMLSAGLSGRDLGQRTLKKDAILYGHCLHSGQKSGLVLEPLEPNSGIHFAKIGDSKTIPAFVDYVDSTSFATTIRRDGVSVSTIEHLLAALHAFRISNLLIKCNDEVPIFDGSAARFCEVIEEVGIEEQQGAWYELSPAKTVCFQAESGSEAIEIRPAQRPGLSVTYELNYPQPVGYQSYFFHMKSVSDFKVQIAPARTFGFMKDIERLQKAGLAAGGRLDNFILIGPEGIVNTELRFPEELARHKILDILGDLFLLGRPLNADVVARMTGHSDNVGVLKQLRESMLSAS